MPTDIFYRTILVQAGDVEQNVKAGRFDPVEIVRLCEVVKSLVNISRKQDTMIEIAAQELNALKELVVAEEKRDSVFRRLMNSFRWI